MIRITLEAARVNVGLTQKEAGQAIGVSAKTIQNWERGTASPRGDRLDRIVEVYGIPFDCLIFCRRNPIKSERTEVSA